MPDDKGRYSPAERDAYTPPPCPVCGGPTRQRWMDAGDTSDQPGSSWVRPESFDCMQPDRHEEP